MVLCIHRRRQRQRQDTQFPAQRDKRDHHSAISTPQTRARSNAKRWTACAGRPRRVRKRLLKGKAPDRELIHVTCSGRPASGSLTPW